MLSCNRIAAMLLVALLGAAPAVAQYLFLDNSVLAVMTTPALEDLRQAVRQAVEGRTLLVDFLRENLGLTGTHVGCETTQCGACVVHVNGLAVKSCTMLALQCEGAVVTTIEGLAAPRAPLHPMQAAFREHHALQCGYCTSGMVMMALDIVRRFGELDEVAIREELKGNICRCTGYHNIVKAITAGAKAMAAEHK